MWAEVNEAHPRGHTSAMREIDPSSRRPRYSIEPFGADSFDSPQNDTNPRHVHPPVMSGLRTSLDACFAKALACHQNAWSRSPGAFCC
jgi:hypothetical protein